VQRVVTQITWFHNIIILDILIFKNHPFSFKRKKQTLLLFLKLKLSRQMEKTIAVFEDKKIRQTEYEGITYFSVVDIIEILSDSPAPRQYWNVLKKREPQLSTICLQLKLTATDGRQRLTDCANTEGVFRIIQSVPSPKAEPFKLWLASLGKQAIDETNDPELLTARQAELYRAKGYPEDWITQRLQSIDTRKELTEEWKKRGVTEGQEFSILTATIAKETFGLTPTEHSQIKGLKKENLRDHMTRIELIFTALGEESTRMLAAKDNAQGYEENHDAAKKGGEFAGTARKRLEKLTGEKVVSAQNFLKASDSEEQDKLPE
jgi:DNA-damage-inducible protein D